MRQTLRSLLKSPSFALAAIATLAVAIAANTAVFTVFHALLLRPLAYPQADELVVLWERLAGRDANENFTPANFTDLRDESRSFRELTAALYWAPSLTGDGTPEKVYGLKATANLFDLIGVQPALGRAFERGDDRPGAERTAVISDGFWSRRFGRDHNVLGQSLLLDGRRYEIIGVAPPGLSFPPFWATRAEIWTTLEFDAERWASRRFRALRVFGRLQEGVTPTEAQREVETLTSRLAAQYPNDNPDLTAAVVPLAEMVVGRTRPALTVLQAAVLFLLILSCANLGNLMLVRAAAKRREAAVRLALGADRGSLARSLLSEGLAIGLTGGLVGLALGSLALDATLSALPAEAHELLPRKGEIGLNPLVSLLSLAAGIATAALASLFPLWRAGGVDAAEALQGAARGAAAGADAGRTSRTLAVAQVGLACILAVGAGLFTRSLAELLDVDPGFEPNGAVAMTISTPDLGEDDEIRKINLFADLRRRIAAVPGVDQVGWINHLPLVGDQWGFGFFVEGVERPENAPSAVFRTVSPGLLPAMGMRLLEGRPFATSDAANSELVALVNRSFVERRLPDGPPLGRRIAFGGGQKPGPWRRIVGVVADVQQSEWGAEASPEIYVPLTQNPSWSAMRYLTLIVRGSAPTLIEQVRSTVWSVDPNLPIADVAPLETVAWQAVARPRFYSRLMLLFSGSALLVAGLGLYGILSYSVALRRREIGVRAAIGASPASLEALVLKDGLRIGLLGVALGAPAALGLAHYLQAELYGISAVDPLTVSLACLTLMLAAAAASWFPARRAARLDPLEALRQD